MSGCRVGRHQPSNGENPNRLEKANRFRPQSWITIGTGVGEDLLCIALPIRPDTMRLADLGTVSSYHSMILFGSATSADAWLGPGEPVGLDSRRIEKSGDARTCSSTPISIDSSLAGVDVVSRPQSDTIDRGSWAIRVRTVKAREVHLGIGRRRLEPLVRLDRQEALRGRA